jgi:hypothetical protein
VSSRGALGPVGIHQVRFTGGFPGQRTVTVTAADATAGVARIEYAIGTGAWATYTGLVAAPDARKHTVSFRALDVDNLPHAPGKAGMPHSGAVDPPGRSLGSAPRKDALHDPI